MTSPQDPNETTEPHSFVDFIGSALVALGFVWMALSGLCGAGIILPLFLFSSQAWNWSGLYLLGMLIAFTCLFVSFGRGLVRSGRKLKERTRGRRRDGV